MTDEPAVYMQQRPPFKTPLMSESPKGSRYAQRQKVVAW